MTKNLSLKNEKKNKDNDSTILVESKFSPDTLNIEDRTVTTILATERKVLRFTKFGEKYYEILSTDPKHLRTERLEKGIPILDNHSENGGVRKQLGRAEGFVKKGNVLETQLRFSRKQDATEVFQDIVDGIVDKTSIGYVVYRHEDVSQLGDEIKTLKAVDWEIFEISCVPIPADIDAQIRSENLTNIIKGDIMITEKRSEKRNEEDEKNTKKREAEVDKENEESNEDENKKEEKKETKSEADENKDIETKEEDDELEKKKLNRSMFSNNNGPENFNRSLFVLEKLKNANIHDSNFADNLIRSNKTQNEISNEIIGHLALRQGGPVKSQYVEITQDEKLTTRSGMVEAILHRSGAGVTSSKDVDGNARRFMGMSLTEMVRHLDGLGYDADKSELAQRAFKSTSDFPLILQDAINKSLAFEFQEAEQTFGPITHRVALNDFKKRRLLKELQNEGGEIKSGSISEGIESYSLATYASAINITRKTIINDDLDVFSTIPTLIAEAVKRKESDIVYKLITSNPVMKDGHRLFSTAHNNIVAGPNFDVATVGKAIEVLRLQKGLDGAYLDVRPGYILNPVAIEMQVRQFLSSNFVATKQADINPFVGMFKQNISDPRLDDASKTKYYITAEDSQALIELGTLDGQGPQIDIEKVFATGVKFSILHDVGAGLVDHRGFVGVGTFA